MESLLAISCFTMGRKEAVHSPNRELASTYSVPGTVLGIGHEGIHQKTRDTKSLALMELMVSQGRQTADT